MFNIIIFLIGAGIMFYMAWRSWSRRRRLMTRGEKVGVLLGAAAFLLAVMALFLLPVPLRQYNPVLWCLCSAFPTDETLFAYPLWGYYAAGSALLAVWVLLWGRVLKTKDIL